MNYSFGFQQINSKTFRSTTNQHLRVAPFWNADIIEKSVDLQSGRGPTFSASFTQASILACVVFIALLYSGILLNTGNSTNWKTKIVKIVTSSISWKNKTF